MKSLYNFVLSISLLASSCSTPAEGAKPNNPEEHVVPAISEEIKIVVHGNTTFAFDLYSKVKNQVNGNLIFSPYSISSALAMVYAGANGMTQHEMEKVLHFPNNDPRLEETFALLNRNLTAEDSKSINATRINIASSLWLQTGMKFLPSFQSTVAKQFSAPLQQVDFAKHPENARTAINHWILIATHGKIPDLLQSHDIDAMTRLMLVNAIYMRGAWQHPFNMHESQVEVFHMEHGLNSQAIMMQRVGEYAYLKENSYAVIELPYVKNSIGIPDISMLIALPDNIDELSAIEEILNTQLLDEWLSKLSIKPVQVILPKFKMTETLSLKDYLVSLGMETAFSNAADFSGITGDKDLSISKIIHKSFIHVDENGTEAAAATAVSVNATAALFPTSPHVFKADHPFIFLIIDKETKSILFLGRVQQP